MFRNYIISAFRNLIRHKLHSLINILGLSIGIACFVLIFLYVKDEKSYEKFNSKYERIYRVCGKLDLEGHGEHSSSCPFPVGPTLVNDFPHLIEKSVRFFDFQDPLHTLKYENEVFNESGLYFVDSSVFDVFDYQLSKGDRKTALDQPNSIVLSKKLAEKYFGENDPMGKILRFEGGADLMVTGVFADLPYNSHIQFEGLISFSSLRKMLGQFINKNWVWNPCWTYILLREGASPEELEKEFPAFVEKNYIDFLKPQVSHHLQKLEDIHLYSQLDYEMRPNSDIIYIYIFSIIGLFILIIASINYINLSTARSLSRARETGIRKVVGATRPQLIFQYLMESLMICFFSFLIALALIELFLPVFNEISGKHLATNIISSPSVILQVALVSFVVGVLSGIYPAFVLSSFDPIKTLKGKFIASKAGAILRKMLVVLQFSISVILVVGTMIVYLQLKYLQSAKLGFDKEQVILVSVRQPMQNVFEPFRLAVKAQKEVVNIASANDILGKHHNIHEYNYEGMTVGTWQYFPTLLVSEDFIPTMKMELIAGRNFSKDFPNDDSLAVIINESMTKELGFGSPENALGKQMFTPSGSERVIGVVKDFNFVSLHKPVGPFALDIPDRASKNYWTRYYYIRFTPGDIENKIKMVESEWKKLTQEFPFEYTFLDDDLKLQYDAQQKLATLVGYFSLLTIFIACLGLYALASYTVMQRTREIGLRKVLGSSTGGLCYLIVREFISLVIIACLIGWIVGYLLCDYWLQSFAHKMEIPVWPFLLSAFLLIIIAVLTVIFKAYRTAIQNPVNSLRYE